MKIFSFLFLFMKNFFNFVNELTEIGKNLIINSDIGTFKSDY